MESRRVWGGETRGCAKGRRGGDSWIWSLHTHISQPTQQHLKTQIVSWLPQRRWTFSRHSANLIIFPPPASVCFPIISLIKADIEECESVASALVPQLHNPSSPLAWRDESGSWHMLEISVITPCGQDGLLVHSSFPLELPFRLSRRSPVGWKACEISRKGPASSDNGEGLLVTCALQKVSRWPCMVAIPGDLFPVSEAAIEFRPRG